MSNIVVQTWDEKKFASCRDEWTRLLENSRSDQLFMSWEWQFTWWQMFAKKNQMQLRLYAAVDANNTLVGIAPLYLSTSYTKKIIPTRRLQFIGNCWRDRATMPTELLDFMVAKEQSQQVIRAIFAHLRASNEWDELILTNLRKDSETYEIARTEQTLPGCYLRHAEEYDSYFLDTTGDFEQYLAGLGKSTRLRLFNRRKILEASGRVNFRSLTDNDEAFDLLNQLHAMRWGKPVFLCERLRFNVELAALLVDRGALRFSVLCVDSSPISIQYNYNINNHVYNIQAGFDPSFHKKLALGYLHFGYEIEQAFNDETLAYDFLAGQGKNTPYKQRLTDTALAIVDLQIVRKLPLKLLLRTYDGLRKGGYLQTQGFTQAAPIFLVNSLFSLPYIINKARNIKCKTPDAASNM